MCDFSSEDEKLLKELSDLENSLDKEYLTTGKIILDIVGESQNKVDCLVDEIICKRKQLAVYRLEPTCPECSCYNEQSSLFCKRCGSELENKIEER